MTATEQEEHSPAISTMEMSLRAVLPFSRLMNLLRSIFLTVFCFCIMSQQLQAADPVVSNISAVQRPGTELVDIKQHHAASNENSVISHDRMVIALIGSK